MCSRYLGSWLGVYGKNNCFFWPLFDDFKRWIARSISFIYLCGCVWQIFLFFSQPSQMQKNVNFQGKFKFVSQEIWNKKARIRTRYVCLLNPICMSITLLVIIMISRIFIIIEDMYCWEQCFTIIDNRGSLLFCIASIDVWRTLKSFLKHTLLC